jgi:hypothetical protein
VGAALVAWLGFLELDVPSAFITCFIVGLVHDLALAALGIPKWGDNPFVEREFPAPEEDGEQDVI